ncbi:MAG: hypothetical protein R3A48_22475 [Polyangiales bacterium]
MTHHEIPRLTIPEPGWSPGPPGSHDLGEFAVGGPASVLTRGWRDDDPRDLGDDRVALSLRPGRWRARLVIQPEGVPAELAEELADHPDGGFLVSTYEVLHGRPWLVLAHADLEVGTPRAAKRVTAASLEGAAELRTVPFVVTTGEGVVASLNPVGSPEPWEHRVAFVTGDAPSATARSALAAASPEDLVSTWAWGLLFLCGRDGSFVVFAAGPESARTVVALPGRI